jgi:tRNA(Ile)-lysidine synthase
VRGTGLRGLTGIQPRNGNILRPLLCVSRQEIEAYLQTKGQEYVTDSTNLEDDVLRNKVRLNVLPMLNELNPAVCENIQNMTMHLTEAQKVLDRFVEKYKEVKCITFKELDEIGSREYLLFEWLKNYGFNGTQVQQIMEAETGGIVTSSLKYDVLKDRESYIVEPSLEPLKPLRIPEDGTYILNNELKFTVKKVPVWVSKDATIATLDAKKVCFPLTVRRVKEGDWMIPYGMEGRKLLSDLMTDRKMTLFEKRRQLVVVDAHDTIIWLVGIRINNQCMVDATTTEVVEIQYQ